MTKCHFVGDSNPFQPRDFNIPPPVGSVLFIEGEKSTWVVKELQYQFFREKVAEGHDYILLRLVNVILKRLTS